MTSSLKSTQFSFGAAWLVALALVYSFQMITQRKIAIKHTRTQVAVKRLDVTHAMNAL